MGILDDFIFRNFAKLQRNFMNTLFFLTCANLIMEVLRTKDKKLLRETMLALRNAINRAFADDEGFQQ